MDSSQPEAAEVKSCKSSAGVFIAFLSALSYSVCNTFVAATTLSSTNLLFLRSVLQVLVITPLTTRNPQAETMKVLFKSRRTTSFVLLATFVGACSMYVVILSMKLISAGDAIAIYHLSVVLSGIFARIFLKETYTVLDSILALIALTGGSLISRLTFIFSNIGQALDTDEERTFGLLLAALSAVSTASFTVLQRKVSTFGTFSSTVNIFYFTLWGSVLATIGNSAFATWAYPCQIDLAFVMGFSIFELLGSLLLIMALVREKAGAVTIVSTLEIVLTLLFQVS